MKPGIYYHPITLEMIEIYDTDKWYIWLEGVASGGYTRAAFKIFYGSYRFSKQITEMIKGPV